MTGLPESFDYIVVGAGSAGCVLVDRLSSDPRNRVLLIEAGGDNRSPLVTMPKGIAKLVSDPRRIWLYHIAQPRHAGEAPNEVWIRGKGLGGSSAINGMIWSRGEAQDYDDWQEAGATGWNAASMLAAYRALEDHELGASAFRGAGGPVHITDKTFRYPLADLMIEAGVQMDLARTDDLNSVTGGRVGYYCHNIRNGRRDGGAAAFLDRATRRPNVFVLTGTLVRDIILSGTRATGVTVENAHQGRFTVRCEGEIILSAGAMESPQILQRTGIGEGTSLQAAGITPRIENPHVGRHLLEHLSYTMPFRLKRDSGIGANYYGTGLLRSLARYYLRRDGPMATGPFEIGAFLSTEGGAARTDLQLYLGGYMFALGDSNDPVPLGNIDKTPGMTISGTLLRLTSEGQIDVRGPESTDAAAIAPNWLSTQEDQRSAVASIRMMRQFAGQAALAGDVGEELLPGAHVQEEDALIDSFRTLSTCGLHGVATCRMGREGEAVVDPALRVYGVDGLRVADCSVMPGLVTGNTNAPAMAVGWRMADILLAGSTKPGSTTR